MLLTLIDAILKNMLVRIGTPIVISVKLIGEKGKAILSHVEDSPVGGGYRPRHGRSGCLFM